MAGGLYDPLGGGLRAEPPRWRPSATLVTASLVTAAVVIFGIAVLLRGGGERGEPRSVVTIERAPPAASPVPSAPPAAIPSTTVPPAAAVAPPVQPASAISPPSLPAELRDADVEIQNGVRIIRMRPDAAKAPATPGTGSSGAPAARAKP